MMLITVHFWLFFESYFHHRHEHSLELSCVPDFTLGALLPFREVDFLRFRVEIFCTETALKSNNSIQH